MLDYSVNDKMPIFEAIDGYLMVKRKVSIVQKLMNLFYRVMSRVFDDEE